MGGDFGIATTLPASLASLKRYPALKLQLFGDSATLDKAISTWPADLSVRCTIHHSSQVTAMGDSPTQAFRKQKDSSLRKAIDAVHAQTADAMVSSGNTGALALTAGLLLGSAGALGVELEDEQFAEFKERVAALQAKITTK